MMYGPQTTLSPPSPYCSSRLFVMPKLRLTRSLMQAGILECMSSCLSSSEQRSYSFAFFNEGMPMGHDCACTLTNTHHVDINHVMKYLLFSKTLCPFLGIHSSICLFVWIRTRHLISISHYFFFTASFYETTTSSVSAQQWKTLGTAHTDSRDAVESAASVPLTWARPHPVLPNIE